MHLSQYVLSMERVTTGAEPRVASAGWLSTHHVPRWARTEPSPAPTGGLACPNTRVCTKHEFMPAKGIYTLP